MTKLKRMGWLGHVAHMGEMRNVFKLLVENLQLRECLEYLYMDDRIIILKCTLK
jgi:hypothetical protein